MEMDPSVYHILTAWSLEPSVWLGVALVVGSYLLASGPWRSRFRASRPVPRPQKIAFIVSSLVILLALVSPLDEISDRYLFSAHMTQHLLLTLLAPPLMLWGTPGWMLRPLLRYRLIWGALRILTMPIVAFALFNVDFMIWHIPALYEATLENQAIHIVEHLLFVGTAILNWWPILSPLVEFPRLPYPVQILYLFLEAVPSTVLGGILVFATEVLYPTYAAAPRLFGISAIDDQLFGGLIMAMPGGMAYLVALSIVFFAWMGSEERAEKQHAVPG
jgi:putative membrane protein